MRDEILRDKTLPADFAVRVGKEAKLCYTESVLMENRNDIVIDLRVGSATGRAERAGALHRAAPADPKPLSFSFPPSEQMKGGTEKLDSD